MGKNTHKQNQGGRRTPPPWSSTSQKNTSKPKPKEPPAERTLAPKQTASAAPQKEVSPLIKAQRAKEANDARLQLDQNPAAYIAKHTITGHAYESHVDITELAALDSVAGARKLGDSVWSSHEKEQECTSEILYAKMEQIQAFVNDSRPGETRAYFAEFTDPDTGEPDYVGRGFISDSQNKYQIYNEGKPIRAMETSVAAVVVKNSPNAPDGWEITTAYPAMYPDLEPENKTAIRERKDVDIEALMHETPTYQQAGPVKKAYMDIAFTGQTPERTGLAYHEYRSETHPAAIMISPETNRRMCLAAITHSPSRPECRVEYRGRATPETFNLANDIRDMVDQNIETQRQEGQTRSLPRANDLIRSGLQSDMQFE